MKILIVGGGGREHALVWKLTQSDVTEMWCAPGNPGIASETLANGQKVVCVPISVTDILSLRDFVKEKGVDLTVVGPETPLALGITDIFETAGLKVFGPNKAAARFEASKCFAQEFAERHGLPFAPGKCFYNTNSACAYAQSLDGHCVVKADGLCSGKGAFVCRSMLTATGAISRLLIIRSFGDAGARIVIQELVPGTELSLQILCDGKSWRLLPTAMDYKRLDACENSPMTGGMGSVSPHPFVTNEQALKIAQDIMPKFLKGCEAEGIVFRGVLYIGLMLTEDGAVFILEFNVRFGDPETQAIIPRLRCDLAEVLLAVAEGRLHEVSVDTLKQVKVACVVVAAPGYPQNPLLGQTIPDLERIVNRVPSVKVWHAGTILENDRLLTSGGRIVGVTAWSQRACLASEYATQTAREVAKSIDGGAHCRTDIGVFPINVNGFS